MHGYVANSGNLTNTLFEKINDIGLVGPKVTIVFSRYSDVQLPTLDDEKLDRFNRILEI